jgi:hypothetical protein
MRDMRKRPHAGGGLALGALWASFVAAAILLLPIGNPIIYGVIVPAAPLALAALSMGSGAFRAPANREVRRLDGADLLAVGGLYVAVVGLFKLAFGVNSGQLNGQLPWASMSGFADVLGLMALALWITARHQRRVRRATVTILQGG